MTDTTTGRAPEAGTALDARGLLGWARRCVERLRQYREEINSLNVFPVADSDTGTNLLHTMRAAVDQAEGEAAWTSEGGGSTGAREIAVALGHGAVHGARGNSGVILSQVLRAVGEAATFTVVDANTLRRALRTAVSLVDHALSDPVEGTIVSVLRAAASGAGRSTASTLVEVARSAADAAAEALDQTTTQLPALRRAGVVDAGGRGLLVLLDTFVEVLSGEAPERREYAPRDGAAVDTGGLEVTTAVPSRGSGRRRPEAPADHEGPRFEVMYSLRHSEESRVDELRGTLRELGDSVVVVGDGAAGDAGRWTVHVHTDEVGGAIECALGLGRVSEIRVTDLFEEQSEFDGPEPEGEAASDAREADGSAGAAGDASGTDEPRGLAPDEGAEDDEPLRRVVAVVEPGPLADLFESAGACVVDPDDDADGAVEDVLAVAGAELVVLPNGHFTRTQIVHLDAALRDSGRHVLIVPTASVVQGLSALAVHDPTTSLSVDGFAMADAAAATRHAHLVRADRAALTLVGRCEPGDLLGMLGHDVALIGTDPAEVVCRLVDVMLGSGGELVTLLLGDEFGADAEAVGDRVRREHPDVEVAGFPAGAGDVLAWIGVE